MRRVESSIDDPIRAARAAQLLPDRRRTDRAEELSPSELVLLDGERFARKRLTGNVRLPHADRKIAADGLVRAILTASS